MQELKAFVTDRTYGRWERGETAPSTSAKLAGEILRTARRCGYYKPMMDGLRDIEDIRTWRRDVMGMNQGQLSEALGVHRTSLAGMEVGLRPVSPLTALLLSLVDWEKRYGFR